MGPLGGTRESAGGIEGVWDTLGVGRECRDEGPARCRGHQGI